MISVKEAKTLITQSIPKHVVTSISLQTAVGYILADDIRANIDIPAFEQSSMDGYAIKFEDREKGLIIKTIIQAGSRVVPEIKNGETARIFTGAPVPPGADTVIMQEKTEVKNGILHCRDENLKQNNNIRAKGSEIKKDDLAMKKGDLLTPAAIGFLAGIGISEVPVYKKPDIALIITGDELQLAGQELKLGQVYESNSFTLKVALKQAGIEKVATYFVNDDKHAVQNILKEALVQHNLILLTGGVSVGDFDFVTNAAHENSIHTIFHRIKQKPGKPLFFGSKDDTLIFGLPGNPASVLTCYYEYVLPAIQRMYGRKPSENIVHALLTANIKKEHGLVQFMKAWYEDGKVIPLVAQESYRMSTFATTNCLICLSEEPRHYEIGEQVEVHMLPITY